MSISGSDGSILYAASGGSPGSSSGGGAAPAGKAASPGAGGGAHTVAAKSSSGPAVYYGQVPALADNGSGGSCITYLPQPAGSAAAAAAVTGSYNGVVSNLRMQSFANCQQAASAGGAHTAAAPPPPPPSAVAATYWSAHGQELLAAPKPYIAPGYALTGLPGYLQTGAPVVQQFTASTPIGGLSIAAHGTFVVDWGDGQSGTYTTPGGPYPTGTITHTWDNVGTYDVSVTEDWTAAWSLGGQRGTLGALYTRGSIPAFQAHQLESVRNR